MDFEKDLTTVTSEDTFLTLGKNAATVLGQAWHHGLHENFGIFLFYGYDEYVNVEKEDLPKFIEWLIAIQNHDRKSGPMPKLDLHNPRS
jgi:hypothetical protein